MRRKIMLAAAALAIAIAVWNWPMTYYIGVDGKVSERRIPLYAKACGFLYRDWAYGDLVREITGGERDGTKKALEILRWVHRNITPSVPAGLKSVDDHPLNIVIRQYGSDDQSEDIFTILCAYAGLRADWGKCYNDDRSAYLLISFVRIGGRWLVFDASSNKYFVNSRGEIASTEDCASGAVVLSGEDAAHYAQYLPNADKALRTGWTRSDEQMPFRRIPAVIKKMFSRNDRTQEIARIR